MDAALCSVGTELLLGDLVDTNAAWLSQRLTEVGVRVTSHLALGDAIDELETGLRWLIDHNDLVVVGGGLGPTTDDLTREAVAQAAGVTLEHRDDLAETIIQAFASRGRRMPPANLRQARIPAGAAPLAPLGTAPGFRIEVARSDGGTCTVMALPGVPWEFKDMAARDVLPLVLERTGGGATVTRIVRVGGMGESSVAELLDDLEVGDGIDLAYLATRSGIEVRLTASGSDAAAARARSEPVVSQVRERLRAAVTGIDDDGAEKAVLDLLRSAGRTVACAESATAGGLCARFASVPGASDVLRGGVVVYATATKHDLAGVPRELLDAHGPVSDEVTRELAVRVRDLLGADYGIGVTGVAGPSPQNGREVGTVIWAVAGPDGVVQSWSGQYPGDRESIQWRLGTQAIEALRRRLIADAD